MKISSKILTDVVPIMLSIFTGVVMAVILHYYQPLIVTLLSAPFVLYFIARRPLNGIFILLPLTVILPPAPQEIGPIELGYIIIFAFTALMGTFKYRNVKNRISLPLLCLFALIVVSFFTRQLSDTSLYHWVRGVVPFLNLIMFFIILSDLRDMFDVNRIIWMFRIIAALIIVLVTAAVIPGIGGILSTGNYIELRASLAQGSFGPLTIMLPVFLSALWLSPIHRSKIDLLLVILLVFVNTLTLLRSAVIIFFIIGALFVRKYSIKDIDRTLLKVMLLLFLMALLSFASYMLSENVSSFVNLIYTGFTDRFARLETIGDVRTLENRVVLQHFMESPLLGHGLGYQFSYDRGNFMGRSYLWSGGYTHNIFTYFLLVFGIPGIILLVWITIAVWKEYIAEQKRSDNARARGYMYATGIGILTLFLYANVQSVFRSVSYMFILSVLLAILVKINGLQPNKGIEEKTIV